MAKPRAIEWLESQTDQSIDFEPEAAAQERHLSVRISHELADALALIAAERQQTTSHLVRDLLADAVARRRDTTRVDSRELIDRLAADVAEVRRRLAG
jgi:Ribbon-helix-helix protein, copG family